MACWAPRPASAARSPHPLRERHRSSSNGATNGIVWEIANTGTLYAFSATTLQELYSASIGAVDHFADPVVADGLVFAAGQGFLDIFGEKWALTSLPTLPTNFSTAPLSGSDVQLAWSTSFPGTLGITPSIQIDYSVGTSGSFTPLLIVSGTLSFYTITGLTAGTQYVFEIQEVDTAGNSAFTTPAGVTPVFGSVLGRNIFYNDSSFDGFDAARMHLTPPPSPPTRPRCSPGQAANFANYTSYPDGINGIAIDISNDFGSPTLADFTFMQGNSSDPSTWTTANEPDSVVVMPGQGTGGSAPSNLSGPAAMR